MPQFTSPGELERKFVQEVYHDIAPGFKHTRYKAWPYVEQFLKSQPAGSIVADVGCGSGKYLDLTTDSFIMGSDSCLKLAEIAHDRQHEVAVCNNLRLPYKDKCFDAVISIGVIHHFASSKRRLKALQELGRILRHGGKMLVYVWAMEQQQRKFVAQDVLVPYTGHQRGRARHRKPTHRNKCHYPEQAIGLILNGPDKPRRSKSCDMLFDRSRYQSSEHSEYLHPGNKNTEDHAISSTIEFKVLKEIIQTIKSKKDHIITNLNAKVTKVYPDKEKTFIDGLLSSAVGRLFDKDKNAHSSKDDNTTPIQEDGSQTRITNVTQFVSSLVKRLFNEKNDSQPPQDIQEEELMKISEKDLKESFYYSLTAWAKEKINMLSLNESKDKVYNRAFLFGGGNLPRGESFDSEYSEVDSDEYQLATCFMDPDNTSSAEKLERKSANTDSKTIEIPSEPSTRLGEIISSSSDSESDGSSSVERLNTDSGISDSEPQEKPASPVIHIRTRAYTTSCYESEKHSASVDDNPAGEKKQLELQRYYHVFIQKELPDLIEDGVDGVDVLKEYYDHGNWAVIAEKQ